MEATLQGSVDPSEARELATMRSLEMSAAYPLSAEAVDEAVSRASPGNYALGFVEDGAFRVFYVGRSDSDVRQRLRDWVGWPSRCEPYGSPAKAAWRGRRRGAFPVDAPAFGRVESAESAYTHFAYSYAASAGAAYAQEWRNYDAFGGPGLDNESEPGA